MRGQGLFALVGPYFPVLELQARWVAHVWAGLRRAPSPAAARGDLASAPEMPMHVMAAIFAEKAGVEPDPASWPGLGRALMFGPLSPASFRLQGPDSRADAPVATAAAARAFGAIASEVFTAQEAAQLSALAAASDALAA